jgi:hypothetical protein
MKQQGLGVDMEHEPGTFKVKSSFGRCDAK